MGHFFNIVAIHTTHRQLARCLFLLGIIAMQVRPVAAQTAAPAAQSALIPAETWIMMGVVVAGLVLLAMKLFSKKLSIDN